MDDVERQLTRGVVLKLVVAAEVDHGPDAVVGDRLPAGIGELPDAVGPDDSAVAGLSSVLGWETAEIADVEAALPGELSRSNRQFRR
jgi:hypothetical protein